MKKLRDIMRHGFLFTVQRGAMVAEAVRTMAANNVGIVAVLDDDRLIVADVDEDYQSAMRKMDQANIRHLPVVSGERLLSMLSIRDLMRVAIEDRGAEIEYLKEYLYQVPPGLGR